MENQRLFECKFAFKQWPTTKTIIHTAPNVLPLLNFISIVNFIHPSWNSSHVDFGILVWNVSAHAQTLNRKQKLIEFSMKSFNF